MKRFALGFVLLLVVMVAGCSAEPIPVMTDEEKVALVRTYLAELCISGGKKLHEDYNRLGINKNGTVSSKSGSSPAAIYWIFRVDPGTRDVFITSTGGSHPCK